MKHLIIYAHPNDGSLNHQFMRTIKESLQINRHDTIIRDLYQMHFNPVLSFEDMNGQRSGTVAHDVHQEQAYITWTDQLTFIYPIWWTGMPAIMKGYIDRVFSYGFAYRYDQGVQKGLLSGKKITVINTQGKSWAEYENTGMDKALSLTSDQGIFTYCGLEIKKHFYFDKADKAGAATIAAWKHQLSKYYQDQIENKHITNN